MLEYVSFDLEEFGCESQVSCPDQLLGELRQYQFKAFECIIPCVAMHIADGCSYLHSQGVSHRDLKLSNILLTNMHLVKLSENVQENAV